MLNCLSVVKKKRKSNTGKLHVYIPANKMVAVGPRISDFVTEISIIDQKEAPLDVTKWKDISRDAKNFIKKVLVKLHLVYNILIFSACKIFIIVFILIIKCRILLTLKLRNTIKMLFLLRQNDYIEVIEKDFMITFTI